MEFSTATYKELFPIYQKYPDWLYLDHGASTHKPAVVIDRVARFWREEYTNIHRGIYRQAAASTRMYEDVRVKVQEWLHATYQEEIIFTSGTTASINLVARGWAAPRLKEGDEIVISTMEHHANLIPWQQICKEKGAILKVIPLTDKGEISMEEYWHMLTNRTVLVACAHVSNTLGTINPIKKMASLAHNKNIPILVDGAQAIAHLEVDLQELGVDFYTFSSHKMYGPDGVGVLFASKAMHKDMIPYAWGGDMVREVSFEDTVTAEAPAKFETGTPSISGVIGMGTAIDFMEEHRSVEKKVHLRELARYAYGMIKEVAGIRVLGSADERLPIFSFTLTDIHPHDIATFLDSRNMAIRAGHHCTQPLLNSMGESSAARACFSYEHSKSDVGKFVSALKEMIQFFG
ncbi:MAG: SufS family cysteine desulfurase [Bacteroidota bacterium]